MTFDLGFLGGGQLARMSIQAAQRMGLQCLSIDESADTPSSQIAPSLAGRFQDPETLVPLFAQCARITLENEFVPAKSIARALAMAGRDPSALCPNLDALAIIQDKLLQREAMKKAGIPGPAAVALDDDGSLAISQLGFPMVLKSRFGGYDGKGVRTVRTAEEFEALSYLWSQRGGWMAEAFVPFKRELAVMVFVSPHGTGCFPTMVTEQSDHVCDVVYPSEIDASDVAIAAVEAIGGEGLFGVELFELEDGKILVNEIAPRPHNTGHYTLEWGGVSQFEQHVRLVIGVPPAPVDGVPAAMANLLGIENAGDWRVALGETLTRFPGVAVHWYGKSESRPGRKMGHINATGTEALAHVRAARETFYSAWAAKNAGYTP